MDIEQALAKETVGRAAFLAPLVALFWVLRGTDGVIGSLLGVGIVVGYFLASGYMLSAAARRSLNLYHAAALFGFFLRLALITVTMLALAQLFDIDRPALGITAVVSYLVLLGWEALAITKGGKKELEWTA